MPGGKIRLTGDLNYSERLVCRAAAISAEQRGVKPLKLLTNAMRRNPEYKAISEAFAAGRLPACVTGVATVHKAHLITSLCEEHERKAFIVVGDEAEGQRIHDDLTMMGMRCVVYPYRELSLRDVESSSREYEHQRLGALSQILNRTVDAVICCVDAALELTIPPEELKNRTVSVRAGEQISMQALERALLSAGYERADQVESAGQFSHRGGILDFFAPGASAPVRTEFWGDEIDTVSFFDPETQRRTDPAETVTLAPSCEAVIDRPEELAAQIEKLSSSLRGKAAEAARKVLQAEAQKLRDGRTPGSADKFLPLLYGGKTASLLDYIDEEFSVFLSEEARVRERARSAAWQFGEDVKGLMEEGVLCRGLDTYARDWTDALRFFGERGAVYLEAFPRGGFETGVRTLVNMTARSVSVWGGGVKQLCEDIAPAIEKNWCVVVLAGTEKAAQSLADDLKKEELPAQFDKDPPQPLPGTVLVLEGGLSGGMEYPAAGVLVITHGTVAQRRAKRRKIKQGQDIQSLSELSPGDYVVHSVHGIGVFEGIHKIEMQGITKDYIKIRYAKQDTLYVPVTQLDLVAKYIGSSEEAQLKLNRLGGTEWQKAKTRVRAAVKDIAKELIALYAKRMQAPGHAFPPDTDWQKDFEAHFEYTETEDQIRCIDEIKADMMRTAPMDRLLCGDVGFGKTEVALRAAFKCIADSKQCALLVPTTILAWQHYQTVLRRMEGFPIRVGLLSRFRTPKQQEKTIEQLRRGEIDMVVGTHRLVQKDVQFRDLGLVIIDEEQRFGVAQKEKLKSLCSNVDVLTLSATPIPRTLNMAMSGIRDMSVIEEAPQDRHPVQTYVLEHDQGIINDAIRRELRRGGQVYYLHNRVESIEGVAARLQNALPDARIAVAHGKMDEETLSEVWRRLLEQEIDVLVCTTIIETGIDVPNVNTLIIENADRMGLSQLHQLRGRVGRSSRRAYAYLTFTRGKVLSEISTKRLEAIREFTEFGSGFRIAMRDLEIRGAGNVLGAQQHGHMEAVGYDMYLKLLGEAIAIEKGETPDYNVDNECLVDIQVQAHIPESYIPNLNQRLDIYRRIADIRGEEDADDVVDEMIDRYGDPPASVTGLVDVALLRNTARSLGIYEIRQNAGNLLIYQNQIDKAAIARLVAAMRGRVLLSAGAKPYLSVKMQQPVLTELKTVLGILRENQK